MRQKHANNLGYSMVEMIIVVAIIAILSAMSALTLRSVDSARYKKAVSTLESELTTLRTTTMAQDSRMAMLIGWSDVDDSYYIVRGVWTKVGSETMNSFHQIDDLPDTDTLRDSTYYDYTGVGNPVKVLERGSLYYFTDSKRDIASGNASTTVTIDGQSVTLEGVVVSFNKGDGTFFMPGTVLSDSVKNVSFSVYRKNDELVANVMVQKTTGIFHETYDELGGGD